MRVLLLPFLFVYVGQVSKESPSGEGFCVVAEGEGQKCSTARNFLQRSVRRSARRFAVQAKAELLETCSTQWNCSVNSKILSQKHQISVRSLLMRTFYEKLNVVSQGYNARHSGIKQDAKTQHWRIWTTSKTFVDPSNVTPLPSCSALGAVAKTKN